MAHGPELVEREREIGRARRPDRRGAGRRGSRGVDRGPGRDRQEHAAGRGAPARDGRAAPRCWPPADPSSSASSRSASCASCSRRAGRSGAARARAGRRRGARGRRVRRARQRRLRGRRLLRRPARAVLGRAQPRRRAPAVPGHRRPALVRPPVDALRRLPRAPAGRAADPRRHDHPHRRAGHRRRADGRDRPRPVDDRRPAGAAERRGRRRARPRAARHRGRRHVLRGLPRGHAAATRCSCASSSPRWRPTASSPTPRTPTWCWRSARAPSRGR